MGLNPMTLAEKLLAGRAGLPEVKAGDLVEVDIDLVMANDITAALAIREFAKLEVDRVFDPDRVVFVCDHFVPAKDIRSAQQNHSVRGFARDYGLTYFFEGGRDGGIEHLVLPEQGLTLPGEVIVGADSHTCTYGALGAFATGMGSTDTAVAMATGRTWFRVPQTLRLVFEGQLSRWAGAKDLVLYAISKIGVDGALYKSLEFTGPAIKALNMTGRFTVSNMAIEAGAKVGLIPVDETTLAYATPRAKRAFEPVYGDPAAAVEEVHLSVEGLEPQVAFPFLPSNTRPISQAGELRIDQVFIGSCTNGRIEDLRLAAEVMAGQEVHAEVRCIVIPGDGVAYRQALGEGLIETFVEAGAVVGLPSCGPCMGGYSGVLGAGERCVSTTNRNFVGRMGHRESEVYLVNPAVAAASAILGRLADPDEIPVKAAAA